ncbi:phospholipid-transporting ATPase ABCA3-like [Haemaphysalis longicornis]
MQAAHVPAAGPRLNLGAPHHGAAVGGSFLWFRQLHVLLWKNIYVKRMRRHYLTTLLEIVLIVALLLGIQDDAVVREPLVRHGSTIYSPASPADLWSALPDMANITRVYFAPSTSYLSWLTRTAFFELGVIEVVELNNQKELATVAMQLANETLPARAIALHYSFPANDDPERPASLHVSFYASRLPFDIQCRYAQRLISQPEGPTVEEFFPEVNTLLPAVAWLQQRHLQFHAQRCNCTLEPIRLRRFPYPPHIEHKDTKNYAFVLTRFCIGVLVPFAVTVARLTEERASGMKEMLRVVGVSDWVYWLSHYLSGFFMHVIIVTLMMLFASVKRNPEGRAFIQFSDPSLLFVILMCFCSSCQLHAILLSTLFASPHSAVAGAMLYWTITCVLPFLTLEHANGQGYHYIERKYKIWSSIFPGINLHWSFRVLERFEKFVDRGANWANFMDHAGTPDNVTLAEIVFVGILADSVIVLLLWYLDNVLPNGPGIPKPLLYPFKITVLLGHNGAGKTTLLSLITGFLNCSSGVVAIGGYDVKTSTRDARYSIGYCPQTNILFDDLTVEEHVMFFGIVKGIPMNIVRTEVVTLLHDVGLSSLRSVLPVDLSLGQQRRLSTALAIIGTPKAA